MNFSFVFSNIAKFTYENPFMVSQNMKEKLFKLYDDIKLFKHKEEININVWPFLLLLFMKIHETDKILDILSIIEKLRNKNYIIKLLFSRIKALLGIIPEIQDYFINILKYQPSEITFMSYHINYYEKYLDLIIANNKYLNNQILTIFPLSMKKNITGGEKILHKIIIIIKESESNCKFDCEFFRMKFEHNYLKILTLEEKKILKDFLKKIVLKMMKVQKKLLTN